MRAKDMVKRYGVQLVGMDVVTQPMGDYPGGTATVLDLGHDPAAPEIVMNVRLRGWGDIGVFDFESVSFARNNAEVSE